MTEGPELVANDKVYSIVQLIYRARHYEGHSEGLRVFPSVHAGALAGGLSRRGPHAAPSRVLARPTNLEGVYTFDLERDGRE